MRLAHLLQTAPLIAVSALMLCAGPSNAQTQAQPQAQALPTPKTPLPVAALSGDSNVTSATVNQPASKANQLIERISIEDASTRIDEVRFGGQTRSITVQPKGGMPAYDIQPETGVRTWKILGY